MTIHHAKPRHGRELDSPPPTISINPPSLYTTPNTEISATVTAQPGTPGGQVTLSMDGPTGSTFTPGGNTGTFKWKPNWSQIKSWTVNFTATDSAMQSTTAPLTVNVVDYGPSISVTPSSFYTTPNVGISATVTGQSSDPAAPLTLGVDGGLPAGATFTPGGNTGTFQWKPNWSQVRSWVINFTVTDPAMMTARVPLTVNVVDYGPSISVTPSSFYTTPNVGISATVTGQSSDPAAPLTLGVDGGLPAGATFTPGGNTGTFQWKPNWSQVRSWVINFTVTDPAMMTARVPLTVNVVDYGPTVTISPSPLYVTVGSEGTATVTAQSSDPTAPLGLTMSGPTGAGFTPMGNTGKFLWTPTAAGSYQASFTATDPAMMMGIGQLSINVFPRMTAADEGAFRELGEADAENEDDGPREEPPKKGRHKAV